MYASLMNHVRHFLHVNQREYETSTGRDCRATQMSGAAQLNAKAACKMNSLEHELLTFSSQNCTALCLAVKCQAFVLVQNAVVF